MNDTTDNSPLPTAEAEAIQAHLKDRADRGITFMDVGKYTVEVLPPEETAQAVQKLKETFASRSSLFPHDEATAEAEAVVMALGPQLEWTKWYSMSKPDTYHHVGKTTPRDVDYYIYNPEEGIPDYYAQANSGRVYEKYKYPTLEAAKIACERHHATGKWE